jgi:hypothetical protein
MIIACGPHALKHEVLDEKHQDQDDDEDDPEHLHPAWCAIGRTEVWPHAGVVAGVAA